MISSLKNTKKLRKCLINNQEFHKEYLFTQNGNPFVFQLNNTTITKSNLEQNYFLIKTTDDYLMKFLKKLKIENFNSAYFCYLNESCKFFGLSREETEQTLKEQSIVDLIILPKLKTEIIIDEQVNTIKFEILQLKKHDFEFNISQTQFPKTVEKSVEKPVEQPVEKKDQLPEKYQKMKRMGIPMEAIKQKMAMDMNQPPKAVLFNSIVLKKTEPIKSKPKTNQFGISLDQIQSILKKLKPIA
jgi:hypothetical protein